MTKIEISKLSEKINDESLPRYATSGSAGMDIRAFISDGAIRIEPGEVVMVPTGLAIALEPGLECQVRSRSGLAAKHGIFALNSPGTIDSDYRGEIKIILANFSKVPFEIINGDRIAQLVIARYEQIEWQIVDSLNETSRGSGGFGSTGI